MKVAIDFSNYDDLIRAGTIAVVQPRIQFGDGTDNVLTRTKAGDAEMLKLELTILEGEFARRKFFASLLVNGTTDGQKIMAERNNATLKRIIASAKFLDLSDRSPETLTKYQMEYRDFDGLRFLAEIGIEPGKDGFEDKNVIARVITKDMPQWGSRRPIEQIAPDWHAGSAGGAQTTAASAAAAAAAPIVKPSWAS
jgi:hypothetical protein